MKILIRLLVVSLLLAACLPGCVKQASDEANPVSVEDSGAEVGFYFAVPAHISHLVFSAVAVVSGGDFDPIEQELVVGDAHVEGTIEGIPAGPERHFEVFVYDDNGVLTYYGAAYSDVEAGTTITVQITLYPQSGTGTVIIVGTFADGDSPEKITFVADYDNGSHDIYIMNPDGSELINLTNTPELDERHPRMSPDRSKIVFQRPNANGLIRAYLMNLDGSSIEEIEVLAGYQIGHCSWSPDGTRLAMIVNPNPGVADPDLYTYSFETGDALQLTENSADDWLAVWSPDGEWIAYASDETGIYKTYRIRPDGSDQHLLANLQGAEERAQEYSPDGTTIVFVARYGSTWDLFSMNADGSAVYQLTDTPDVNEFHHAWSPDGTSLLYARESSAGMGIYVMTPDGHNDGVLIDEFNHYEDHPHWR